jgi:hypothetical protein
MATTTQAPLRVASVADEWRTFQLACAGQHDAYRRPVDETTNDLRQLMEEVWR